MDTRKQQEESCDRKGILAGIWTKCKKCDQVFLHKDLEGNLMVCPKCSYHTRIDARKRIDITVDKDSFEEMDKNLASVDFLNFPGYKEKIEKLDINDAVVTGKAKIGGYDIIIAAMDFSFMGGSMGSVVGEKISRAIEKAIKKKYPVIIVSSSGGARMQEGIVSLMQMAKTSAALAKLSSTGLAYISILTDPTTGGVAASFAMLGDVNIAEPKALIGFAGPRVIEQTIRQQLPEGFQMSEFLEDHGMVDIVVERKNMRDVLIKLLKFFSAK